MIVVIVYIARSQFINDYFDKNDITIERDELEKQSTAIKLLSERVDQQNNYINALQRILNGEVAIDTDLDSISTVKNDYSEELDWRMSEEEKQLQDKLSKEMNQAALAKEKFSIMSFSAPLKGVISQSFEFEKHPGVDVVAKVGTPVHAILGGTVIYAGYTLKDGHIVIIEHNDKILSIYKHNESVLRSIGDKVRQGDPIAFVGNSGENTDGPHLHFELWYNQSPMDPSELIDFTD